MESPTAVIEVEPLVKESTDLVLRANQAAEIITADHYEQAAMLGKSLRAMAKGIAEFWEPLKKNSYNAWKALVARENDMLKPVQDASRALDGKIGAYLQKQEHERLQREQEASAAAQKAEQERLFREAQQLSQLGQTEEAEKVLDEAVTASAPPVVLPSSVPKLQGVSNRTTWKWRITEPSKISREYLIPDETKIGQIVRALKKSAEKTVGGIEVWEEKSVSMRT